MCCVYVCVYVCVWRERERIRGESGKRGFIGALTLSLSFFLFFFLIFFSWRGERCATFAFFFSYLTFFSFVVVGARMVGGKPGVRYTYIITPRCRGKERERGGGWRLIYHAKNQGLVSPFFFLSTSSHLPWEM